MLFRYFYCYRLLRASLIVLRWKVLLSIPVKELFGRLRYLSWLLKAWARTFTNVVWQLQTMQAASNPIVGSRLMFRGQWKKSASILGREKCSDSGVCIAQSGQDQLGLAKVVGWSYRYNPSSNTVNYWSPEAKRVPHKGQPVAATSGYYREISPAKTTCTPTYSGGIFINGVYKKIIQAKLVRRLLLKRSGLQGLQVLQVVLAGILM